MSQPARRYRERTLKILFGRSGNQCAHPDCANPVIEPATEQSPDHVAAQICHIEPIGLTGPRAGGLRAVDQLNNLDNLILLCGHHHSVVDGQHESYPVDMLREWKRAHEAKVSEVVSRPIAGIEILKPGMMPSANDARLQNLEASLVETNRRLAALVEGPGALMPVDAIDNFISAAIDTHERARAIADPASIDRIRELGHRAFSGDLSGASSAVKTMLFRLLAATEARAKVPDKAETWLELAVAAGANDVAPDRARIAAAREQFDTALALIAGRGDTLSNSLRVDVLRRRDGRAVALAHFENDLGPTQVTGFLLSGLSHWLAEENRFDDSESLLAQATPAQLEENPPIRFVRARARLALCVASDQRRPVFKSAGLLPHPSTLRDDPEGGRLLGLALDDLRALMPLLDQLGEPDFASFVAYFEQYLALASHDPEVRSQARSALRRRLDRVETLATFAPLAKLFGIKFDRSLLQSHLDQAARLGPWDDAQLRAALDLVVQNGDGAAIVSFIDQHRDRLVATQGAGQTIGLQVEALARMGRAGEARDRLAEAGDAFTATETHLLRDIIAECEAGPSTELHLERFEASDEERDLVLLVDALIDASDPRIADYAAELWRRRHRIDDAVNALGGFAMAGRERELERFLEDELGDVVALDPRLQTHAAWMHYRSGDLAAATELLTQLRLAEPDDAGLRQLEINIAIEGGEWHKLTALVGEDLARADHRSETQLLQAAGLAHAANSPTVMSLLRAAILKAPDDPHVLINAYEMAVRRGEDTSEEVWSWIQRGISVSGENGPIRSARLADFLTMHEESRRRAVKLDGMIMSGEVTLGAVAKPLGTTLSGLILERIRNNSSLSDPRARLYLPFYAGNRDAMDLDGVSRIALDVTSILLLHLTGQLDRVFEAFELTVIPSGTLPTLFEDLRRADRGQPSRAARAARIRELAAHKILTVFEEEPAGGDEDFDILFRAAERLDGFVIHGLPIHVEGSMLEETRDPTPFAMRLVSPAGIAATLFKRGEISEADLERARKLPTLTETWPEESPVHFDKPLLLDGIALLHLLDADLIEPLHRAGADLRIRPKVLEVADREIGERQASQRLAREIEAVRASLNGALERGVARIGPAPRVHAGLKDVAEEDLRDPLLSVLQDAGGAELLVCDERMVNGYRTFTDSDGASRPVASSLDILEALRKRQVIDEAAHRAALHVLRASGVGQIPVTAAEIVAAAKRGDWKVGPGRELRAIRDSIQLPLLRRGVRLPAERNWLEMTMMQVGLAIRRCFREFDDVELAGAAADFLLAMVPDLRGYTKDEQSVEIENWTHAVLLGFHSLIASPLDVQLDRIAAYHAWYECGIVERLRGQDRDIFESLLDRLKLIILEDRPEFASGEAGAPGPAEVTRWIVAHFPKLLANRLLEDRSVRIAVGQVPPDQFAIAGRRVSQAALLAFLRSTLARKASALRDIEGKTIARAGTVHSDGSVSIDLGDTRLRFESAALLSSDDAVREAETCALLTSRTLDPASERHWLNRARAAPLANRAFATLTERATQTAQGFACEAGSALEEGNSSFTDLVPLDEPYYRSLFAPGASRARLDTMVGVFGKGVRSALAPHAAALTAGPLAIAPGFNMAQLAADVDPGRRAWLAASLAEAGDLFSLLAAFQLVCGDIDDPALRQIGDLLFESFWNSPEAVQARAEDFCFGARLTIAVAHWRGQLHDWSLHGRRTALLAHAGQIARVLSGFEVDRPGLLAALDADTGHHYRLTGILESGEAIEWQHGLMTPEAIAAYLLRRFDQTLDRVPEDRRPANWLASIARVVERTLAEGHLILLGVTGPLDEFSAAKIERKTLKRKSFGEFLDHVEGEDADMFVTALTVAALGFDRPARVDLAPLAGKVAERLLKLSSPQRDQAIGVALALAVKWRAPDVAAAILDAAQVREDPIPRQVEWILTGAASEKNSAARLEATRRGLERLAFRTTDAKRAAALTRAIETVSNSDPRLIAPLTKARVAAVLAT